MNVKRILTITLAVVLVCALFAGAGSAFIVTKTATSNPSGSLVPGQEVISTMEVEYKSTDSIGSGKLWLNSDLTGVSWTVEIIKGGVVSNTLNPVSPYNYVDGFLLYDSDATVRITAKGVVSSTSANSYISAITLSEAGAGTTGDRASYSSPQQFVYDTGNLAGSLAELNNAISTQDARIVDYTTNYGSDCSVAKGKVEAARSKYLAAQTAEANSDEVQAFKNIEEGMNYVNDAEMSLAGISLGLIKSYIDAVNSDINALYAKGWNTEAKLLDTKNSGFLNLYNELYNIYKGGKAPVASDLDTLRNQVAALYGESQGYIESSENPLGGLMNYLPYILIGVGVVVVGIVVFIIIRKRRNSWDELG